MNPYHYWLGLPKDLAKPTYYQLLGVSHDAPVEAIRESAKRVLLELAGADGSPAPEKLDELKSRVRRAEKTLRSPERRAEYDRRLEDAIAAGAAQLSVAAPQRTPDTTQGRFGPPPAEDVDPMAPYLPPGLEAETPSASAAQAEPDAAPDAAAPIDDPSTAAPRSGFHPLAGTAADSETIDLSPLRPDTRPTANPAPVQPAPVQPATIYPTPIQPAAARPEPAVVQPAAVVTPTAVPVASPVGVGVQAPVVDIRRKRSLHTGGRRALARGKRAAIPFGFYAFGLICVGAIAGVLYVALVDPDLLQIATAGDEKTPAVAPQPQISKQDPPQTVPASEPPRPPQDAVVAPGEDDPVPPPRDSAPSPSMPAEPQPPSDPEPTPPPAKPDPAPTPPPSTPKELTDEQAAQLRTLLVKAREAMESYEFDASESALDEAAQLAAGSQERGSVERQQDLLMYLRRFQELIEQQIPKIPAGAAIKFRSTEVALVQSDVAAGKILVKFGGGNVSFDIRPLPIGLGLGIAEGWLDESAGTKVLIGTFLATHPKRRPEYIEQARQLWREAESSGIDLNGLESVLDPTP